jgi:hypothetical protein
LVLDIVSLLGFTLEPSKTPEPSTSLDILGVTVSLQSTTSGLVISTVPDRAKVDFWLRDIQDCLASNSLPLGLASQLVGRLSFAAWAVWGHIARSRLRSLYDFLLCGAGEFPLEVRESLQWWEHRLQSLVPRLILLKEVNSSVLLIYTDAEGSGGLGALLTGTEPSEWFMGKADPRFQESLLPRKTQIFAFETVTVLLASMVWVKRLSGRRVVFFVDNTASLGCLRKGSSSKPDIHSLIGFFWDFVIKNHIEVHFRWVPSKLNLGDRPSRNCAPIVGRQTPFRVRWTQILQLVNSSKRAHLHDSFEVKTVLSE